MNDRRYGLYFRAKDRRWVRLFPTLALPKRAAVRVFQSMLLELSFRGKCPALRPV